MSEYFEVPTKNFEIDDIISSIKTYGFANIENVFSASLMTDSANMAQDLLFQRLTLKQFCGCSSSVVLHNYLRDNICFLSFLDCDIIHLILGKLMDENFTLTNMVLRNRTLRYASCFDQENIMESSQSQIGASWHVDSRYTKKINRHPFASYIVCIHLETVDSSNSPTLVYPLSHVTSIDPTLMGSYYPPYPLYAKSGSVTFMDANLIHTGSEPSHLSKWAVFHLYSPWYIKPYYNFFDMFNSIQSSLPERVQKILHFNSQPPADEFHRRHTLIKFQ